MKPKPLHGIDLVPGLPQTVPQRRPRPVVKVRDIGPTHAGSKDWQPSALSLRTGLVCSRRRGGGAGRRRLYRAMNWAHSPAS
ncbi:hypothetical protein ABXN37_13430 [Piscinibacter sakaiensis]|uniref:hypothetical protein n=1 Tax=Piscinibacter sakaiensis TaxID=1547922 RepID=UPI00372CA7DD